MPNNETISEVSSLHVNVMSRSDRFLPAADDPGRWYFVLPRSLICPVF